MLAHLIIRNRHHNPTLRSVRFNLKTGVFSTSSKEHLNRMELLNRGFSHPILDETPLIEIEKNHYAYPYANEKQFCLVLRAIYATLLQVAHPASCVFQVFPTKVYLQDHQTNEIYFSCHAQQHARERIKIKHLNAMISAIQGVAFQYGNRVLLNLTLTWTDLAQELDADCLYNEATIKNKLKHSLLLEQSELRFINSQIGFGLFARTDIKKGTILSEYCGQYSSKKQKFKNYCYLPKKTSGIRLPLDGRFYGNMTRFINHAPEQSEEKHAFITANIEVDNYHKYGMSRIMLMAKRDIKKGEQLLTSYGQAYFNVPEQQMLFTQQGQVLNHKRRRIHDSIAQSKRYLVLFAQYGNKRAQWLLIKRPLLVLIGCIGLGLYLQ